MKASPLSSISSAHAPPVKSRRDAQAPHFNGMGDAVSSLVGVIDSNRMMELMASDGIGMILPRTALALKCRGADDGRETFLREASGLIGNIFLAGWAGYGMARLLGDTVNAYNPKGIPARAWITTQNLDAFGKIYQDELQKVKYDASESNLIRVQKARAGFINSVLNGLESDDREFSIEGRISSLEQLGQTHQHKLLEQMRLSVQHPEQVQLEQCKGWMGKLTNLKGQLKNPTQKAEYNQLREKLRRHFLDAGWGKLSGNAHVPQKDQLKHLRDAFALKDISEIEKSVFGTLPLDKLARQRVKEQKAAFIQSHHLGHLDPDVTETEKILQQKGFDSEKEFIKQRLSRSVAGLGYEVKKFQEHVDKEALRLGLTSSIDLHYKLDKPIDGVKTIKLSSNRGILLKEMKHFLEQYADRAANALPKERLDEAQDWGTLRQQINHNLNASPKQGLLQKLIPQVDDGLITAAIKSRGAYTWIPMIICFATAGAFTFYNNYLTMKKHKGQVFFPGEGMPPMDGAPKSVLQAGAHQTSKENMGVYRNFGTFPNYPQFRNSQGGIIA